MELQDLIIGMEIEFPQKKAKNYNWAYSRVDADLSGLDSEKQEWFVSAEREWHSQGGRFRNMQTGKFLFEDFFALCENQEAEKALKSALDDEGLDYNVEDVQPSQAQKEKIKEANVVDKSEIASVLQ